jgi:hypothetical protein
LAAIATRCLAQLSQFGNIPVIEAVRAASTRAKVHETWALIFLAIYAFDKIRAAFTQ